MDLCRGKCDETNEYIRAEIPSEVLTITLCGSRLPALQAPFRTFLPYIHVAITDIGASIISTLTMAPIEMVQYHPPMSLPASNTPPDSPGLPPVAILSDNQATDTADAMAAMKVVPIIPVSHLPSAENPFGNPPPSPATPRSPTPCQMCSTKSPSQVAVEFAQQITEALKFTNTKQGPPPPVEPSGAEKPKARASTIEFKEISEV